MEDYLLKPIDEDELNRQLQKIVAEEEQREDKQQQVDQIEKNWRIVNICATKNSSDRY